MSEKTRMLPAMMSEADDGWEFAEDVEERKDKDGRYKKGCLFFVLLYCPTKTAIHRIRTCSYVNEFAAAAHDLDVYSQEDMEKALKKGRIPDWKVGELKKHHVHAFLRCSQVRPDTLASALEIPVNHVQYVKKTKVFGCLSYLTHALWPEKHLYDDSEVISNYDWKAERDGTKRVNVLEDILSRIDSGEITENNYVHMLPIATAVKYERQMQSAFKIFRRKHAHENIIRTNIYIQAIDPTSGSGSGKSLLAEELAKWLCKHAGWDYAWMGSGKDIFGAYQSQEVIIMDDRGFESLERDQFMAMFDIRARGEMPSRFKDKAARWIVSMVTNVNDFEDKILEVKGLTRDEDLTQLRRRFEFVIKVSPDTIQIFRYNDITKRHELQRELENFVLKAARAEGGGRIETQNDLILGAIMATVSDSKARYEAANESERAADAEWARMPLDIKQQLLREGRRLMIARGGDRNE